MTVGVVCNDMGGAKILLYFVKNNKDNFLFFLNGPAKKIFKNEFKSKFKNNNLKNIIKCNFVLTATSEISDHEIKALNLCKKYRISSASFLDHWSYYKERFYRKGRYTFPNEIWTGDRFAFKLAKKIFKFNKIKIKFVANPYFKNIKKLEKLKTKYILYVSSAFNNYNINEYFFFENVLKKISSLGLKKKHIIFKPHPSENSKAYKNFFKKFKTEYKVSLAKNDSIEYYLKHTEAVFGYNSMVLVIANLLKIKSYNCIFHKKLFSILPYKNIKTLNVK